MLGNSGGGRLGHYSFGPGRSDGCAREQVQSLLARSKWETMPKLNANLSMMFNEVDFLDRFAAASKAGFKGVEFLFPYAYDKNQLAELAQKNKLQVILFNMPPGDWNAGD